VLALQAALINKDQFAEACSAWTTRKETPLADLLEQRGMLSAPDRREVERLVQRHLRSHRGDAAASLVAVVDEEARLVLSTVDDSGIRRSLDSLPEPGEHVIVSTAAYTPQVRERYTLTRLHARGGIGQVWLARDGDLGREVALKELRPGREESALAWQRFVAEAQITGQLEHPGIVPVYELVKPSGERTAFYTMRFLRGRTLSRAARAFHKRRSRGRSGNLDQFALLNAFVGVCNAVAYAHSRGVIHRDLKGDNVVLGDFGEAVVLDWGLAKVLGRPEGESPAPPVAVDLAGGRGATVEGQVLGTPAYMAPEQARGRLDQITERTDVYGLGTILYEILTGVAPFRGDDTQELLRQVREEEPPRPREVVPAPPALEAICLKAMSKRPADRYPAAGELAADVQRWLADEPVTAYREPVHRRVVRWGRQHPALVAAAAVLLLAVAAGGLWLKYDRDARVALAARDAALREGMVHAELQGAGQQLRRGDLDKAREAVERAQDRLVGGPGDLQQQVRQARGDLDMVVRLEEVLLLETFTAGKHENTAADAAYAAAFQTYGLDLATLEAAAAADRIQASSIREQLVIALDDWIFVKPRGDAAGRERLLAVVRLADTDAWRQRLRDPARQKDRPALEELARSQEVAGQPPSILVHLGKYLAQVGGWSAAVEVLGQAQRRFPGDFWVNYSLAMSLNEQKPARPAQAIGFFRAALAIRPQSRIAHFSLARALLNEQLTAEAVAHFRQADLLAGGGGRSFDALVRMGDQLIREGEYSRAAGYFQAARELLAEEDTRREAVQALIRNAEHLVQLEGRVQAVARGAAPPESPDDKVLLAFIAQQKSRLYATSARLYREAFAARPQLAEDMQRQIRYNAACAAALSGVGQGDDAAVLDGPARAAWRKQALAWLRADLEFWAKTVRGGPPQARLAARATLLHWQEDPDFAGDPTHAALQKLPPGQPPDGTLLGVVVGGLLHKTPGGGGR
jgi:tetratricopeptide (TPR) repeat protein/tRNA A-37 threonylcarbamoyl transferase component Bud32